MFKNQTVLCKSGDFTERSSHSWSGRNTGFEFNQWTKADIMFKIKLSFLVGKPWNYQATFGRKGAGATQNPVSSSEVRINIYFFTSRAQERPQMFLNT